MDVFKVVEVYYEDGGKIRGWSDTSDSSLVREGLADLKTTAQHILDAFNKPVVLHIPEENDALVDLAEYEEEKALYERTKHRLESGKFVERKPGESLLDMAQRAKEDKS